MEAANASAGLTPSSTTSAIDWNYFISKAGKAWQPSAIRGFFHLLDTPGMLSLLAGEPDPVSFPIDRLEFSVKPIDDGSESETIVLSPKELEDGMQYNQSAGFKGLVQWLTTLQQIQHNREDVENWRVCVGSGSLDLMTKAFLCLIDEGDSVLIETPVFAGTLGYLQSQQCSLIDVATDGEGLKPDDLEHTLANWSTLHPGKRFPKFLYTIPTGSNPSGASSPESRKLQVIELARRYNLLIIEDDAYFYLFYGTDKVTSKPASYLELEQRSGGQVGRVIRLDTMSKILSSGMRIGFMTAAPEFMDVIGLCTTSTTLQPNSLSQAIALALLTKWGHAKFFEHTQRVAQLYKARRDMFEKACHKYLPGLATWVTPDTGMFLYLNLNLTKDGSAGDSYEVITKNAIARGVLAVPGVGFSPTKQTSSFVRVSFSQVNEQEADEAIRRLAEVVREVRGEGAPQANGFH